MSDMKTHKKEMVRKRSPHHRVVYANQIGSTNTANDVRLRFGCIESATAELISVEDQVDVFLGPAQLVALHQMLGRVIQKMNIQVDGPIDIEGHDDIKQTVIE